MLSCPVGWHLMRNKKLLRFLMAVAKLRSRISVPGNTHRHVAHCRAEDTVLLTAALLIR